MLSTSAIGTRPSRTARKCSGPLKPSWPPALTVISTPPLVAFLTSSAKRMAFLVWKLPSGQTVDRSHLVWAAAEVAPSASARTAAATRPAHPLPCLLIQLFSPSDPRLSANLAHAELFRKPKGCASCTFVVRVRAWAAREGRHVEFACSRLFAQRRRIHRGSPRIPSRPARRPAGRRHHHRSRRGHGQVHRAPGAHRSPHPRRRAEREHGTAHPGRAPSRRRGGDRQCRGDPRG